MSWPRYTTLAPPERQRPNSHWNQSDFSLLGGRGRFASPLQATCTSAFGGAPISSTKPRTLHRGFGFIVVRESSDSRNAKPPRVFDVMDGKALPNILDRCSMSFFQPSSLDALEPYQLEFLEISSSRLGLKLYRDIARFLLSCGSTYKQKSVQGSVPSSREE